MSDPHLPESDAGERAGSDPIGPTPAIPPIDLSEPEPPAPIADPPPFVDPSAPTTPDASDSDPFVADDTPPSAPPSEPSDATRITSSATGEPMTTPPSRPKGPPWAIILAALGGVAVLIVVVFAIRLTKEADKVPDVAVTTTTTFSTAGYVTFTDEMAGFKIQHPKDWDPLPIQGAERLLLRAGPESAAQITVRNIPSTDAPAIIQQVMADVNLVEDPREFKLNGLPAVVYIYKTPVTKESPDEGVVVHYFVLSPSKMYQLVFVTRPATEINRLGRTISAVSESFEVTSDALVPEPASTSMPPTTATATTTTKKP